MFDLIQFLLPEINGSGSGIDDDGPRFVCVCVRDFVKPENTARRGSVFSLSMSVCHNRRWCSLSILDSFRGMEYSIWVYKYIYMYKRKTGMSAVCVCDRALARSHSLHISFMNRNITDTFLVFCCRRRCLRCRCSNTHRHTVYWTMNSTVSCECIACENRTGYGRI